MLRTIFHLNGKSVVLGVVIGIGISASLALVADIELPIGFETDTVLSADALNDNFNVLSQHNHGFSALGTLPGDCMDIITQDPNAADGNYTIDPDGAGGPVMPYIVYCNMTIEGGGWTRIISIDKDTNYVGLDGIPNEQEFVSNGTFHFSKTQLINSNHELLILEAVSPFRMHMYDFKRGTNPQGEDFVGTVTGDLDADVAIWNWTLQSWQQMGAGRCAPTNFNNHSQWNCVTVSGVRFHYATRDWAGDGGTTTNTGWVWFTGYDLAGSVNLDQLVANWNNSLDKTPHNIYIR